MKDVFTKLPPFTTKNQWLIFKVNTSDLVKSPVDCHQCPFGAPTIMMKHLQDLHLFYKYLKFYFYYIYIYKIGFVSLSKLFTTYIQLTYYLKILNYFDYFCLLIFLT